MRFRTALVLGVALCFFAAVPPAAQAAPGDLDLTFGTDGVVLTAIGSADTARGVALQSDGKIVAAGECSVSAQVIFCLARYNSDGSLDTTFGSGGTVTTKMGTEVGDAEPAWDLAIQSDGKIVVAGSCFIGTSRDFCLARYEGDGSLDTDFGAGGKVTTDFGGGYAEAFAVALQGDGKIVAAGDCVPAVGLIGRICLARYTSNGSPDPSFGSGGQVSDDLGRFGFGGAIAVQADGKIVAGGFCGTGRPGDPALFCVARYTASGAVDIPFGLNGVVTPTAPCQMAWAVSVQPDEKILAAGASCLVRINSGGSPDATFGDGGAVLFDQSGPSALSMALQHDGKVVVGGQCPSQPGTCLARINANGSPDASFGNGGTVAPPATACDVAWGIALQSDGKIVTAGGSGSMFCLARYEVDTASTPVITPSSDVTAEATGPSGAAVSYPNPTATDAIDGTVPVICVPASGATFAVATTTVDCTATNSAGNSSHTSFSVTVRDTTQPTLTVPANVSVSTSNPAGATVSYDAATASDLVDGPMTPICAPASGSTFPIATTTVNCTATDAHGNAANASFTVTVTLASSDTRPPTLRVPASITRQATGPGGALINYSVTATDPTNTPAQITIICTSSPTSGLSSGSIFPVGTTTITCNAHDPAGNNAAPKSFTITVRDTTKPVISPTSNVKANATGPSGAIVNYPLPTATDIVDVTVPVICTPAPGATFPIGTTAVNCTATDHAGNTATRRFTVTVLSAAQQIAALKTQVNNAPELGTSTSTRLVRSTLIRDLNNALSSTQSTACAAITKFISDVQANSAPLGPITAANSTLWVSEATQIRAVRGC